MPDVAFPDFDFPDFAFLHFDLVHFDLLEFDFPGFDFHNIEFPNGNTDGCLGEGGQKDTKGSLGRHEGIPRGAQGDNWGIPN